MKQMIPSPIFCLETLGWGVGARGGGGGGVGVGDLILLPPVLPLGIPDKGTSSPFPSMVLLCFEFLH